MRGRGFDHKVHVVDFTTSISARAEAYRSCSVLLAAPRFGEGIYQPAWEAMAAGCALVMTNCEALATLPEGTRGVEVVRQGDVEGMVRALFALRDRKASRFTAERVALRSRISTLPKGQEAVAVKKMLTRVTEAVEASS